MCETAALQYKSEVVWTWKVGLVRLIGPSTGS